MTTQGKLASGKAERTTVAGAVGGSSILPGQEPVVNNVVSQPQLTQSSMTTPTTAGAEAGPEAAESSNACPGNL